MVLAAVEASREAVAATPSAYHQRDRGHSEYIGDVKSEDRLELADQPNYCLHRPAVAEEPSIEIDLVEEVAQAMAL